MPHSYQRWSEYVNLFILRRTTSSLSLPSSWAILTGPPSLRICSNCTVFEEALGNAALDGMIGNREVIAAGARKKI
jgi:hypothetical protein